MEIKNAREIKTQSKKILTFGPTGSGKTTLFLTIPGRKLIYLCDPGGLDTIRGHDVSYVYVPPDTPLGIRGTKHGRVDIQKSSPKAYKQMEEAIIQGLESSFQDYDAIAISSVTMLAQMAMDYILWVNGRFGHTPELADYNILGETLNSMFRSILSIPDKIIFIEGHDVLVEDEVSHKVHNRFDIVKNVRRVLPRLCTDVLITYCEAGEKGPAYGLQTAPSREYPDCKNSMELPQYVDVTLDFRKPLETQGLGRYLGGGNQTS